MIALYEGLHVISLSGELNEIEDRGEVHTGPCALGVIETIYDNQEYCYSVIFPATGVSIMLSDAEIEQEGYIVTASPEKFSKIVVDYYADADVPPDVYLVAAKDADQIAEFMTMAPTVMRATALQLA